MYRAGIEGILGLSRAGDTLRIAPCFPSDWPEVTATVTFGQARFTIRIANPQGRVSGILSATLNGNGLPLKNGVSIAISEGNHIVEIVMGAEGQ